MVAQNRPGKTRKTWDELLVNDRKMLGMGSADPQNLSEWRGCLPGRLVRTDLSSVQETGLYMGRLMRKPMFCICENKDADQLHGNQEADKRLCFRYMDNTIHLLPKPKFQAHSHLLSQWLCSPVCV